MHKNCRTGCRQEEKWAKNENEEIKKLSEQQKPLRNNMNSTDSKKKKYEIRIERNKVMKEIHNKLEEENQKDN